MANSYLKKKEMFAALLKKICFLIPVTGCHDDHGVAADPGDVV